MKKTKENKGITLIALVITIIVLLILAGVSIAMLTRNNGIIIQAKLAKENTATAEEQEEKELQELNGYINEKTKKDNYTDINGDKATIPEGFNVDETENVISKGLVVHGPDKVNGDNGSEFVWVPVSDINSMSQCSKAGENCNLQLEDGTLKCKTHNDNEEIVGKLYSISLYNNNININPNTLYNENNGFREPAIITNSSDGSGINYDNDKKYCNPNLFSFASLKEDYKKMAISVAKYKGFYIGRYETSLLDATSSSVGKNEMVQSKPGVIPTSANNSATYRWYGLYKSQNKTYKGENDSVESSMIWGSQYDAMLNWIKSGTNEAEKNKITNISLGNNESGNVEITGNYANDSVNNIKDLGGNLREWTLEAYGISVRILRGGYYNEKNSPSYRTDNNPDVHNDNYGSRMALYIK